MDWMTFAATIPTMITLLGVVVWCVRQEGRINAHDALFIEREKQQIDRWDDVKERLGRIETKLDNQTIMGLFDQGHTPGGRKG